MQLERFLPDEAATARLGEDIGAALRPGDVVALRGGLGAGKSTLARALIRALAGDPGLEVPSPTFTLVQTYPEARPPVAHLDLYRLGTSEEVDELGLAEVLEEGIAVVEWPERAESGLPDGRLTVSLTNRGEGRQASVTGEGALAARVERSLLARGFLDRAGWGGASRRPLTGDASARRYEAVSLDAEAPRLLMDSPRLEFGPPVRDGKAYGEIAHTARTVHAFVAVDTALARAGFAVPRVHAWDGDDGFLLVEDLGRDGVLDGEGRPIPERYEAAMELLAEIHRRGWSAEVEADGLRYAIPAFDRDALLIEAELLLDWFVPFQTGSRPGEALRRDFRAAWNRAIDRLEATERSLTLRDCQCTNLIWREEREGLERIGLIDFQDALIGPAAYDVASLAMDARVTISPELEAQLVDAYEQARVDDEGFDSESFRFAYAATAAQRNSKILGIFVRLKLRDGKDGYVRHLLRIQAYLARALAHPALTELRALYEVQGFLRPVG